MRDGFDFPLHTRALRRMEHASRKAQSSIVSAPLILHHTYRHPRYASPLGTDTSTPRPVHAARDDAPAKAAPVDCRLPACAPIIALFTSRPWLVSNVLAPCLRWILWMCLSALSLPVSLLYVRMLLWCVCQAEESSRAENAHHIHPSVTPCAALSCSAICRSARPRTCGAGLE